MNLFINSSKQVLYTEKNTTLSQVNFVIFSQQDRNLFESSINLLGSSIFVFLSQKDFLFELKIKYAWVKCIFYFELKRKFTWVIIFVCLSQIDFFYEPKEDMLGSSKYLLDSKRICLSKVAQATMDYIICLTILITN